MSSHSILSSAPLYRFRISCWICGVNNESTANKSLSRSGGWTRVLRLKGAGRRPVSFVVARSRFAAASLWRSCLALITVPFDGSLRAHRRFAASLRVGSPGSVGPRGAQLPRFRGCRSRTRSRGELASRFRSRPRRPRPERRAADRVCYALRQSYRPALVGLGSPIGASKAEVCCDLA